MGNVLSCFDTGPRKSVTGPAHSSHVAHGVPLKDPPRSDEPAAQKQQQQAKQQQEEQQEQQETGDAVVQVPVPATPPDLVHSAPAAQACVAYAAGRYDGDPNQPLRLSVPSSAPWDLRSFNVPTAPNEEQRRLNGLAIGIYTAPKCPELDFLMNTLCRIFEVPYTSMALYYNRSCWLAHTWGGFAGGNQAWKISACPWNCLVTQPQTIVCGDLQEDARFHHQPWVESGLRCYVSAPMLTSNGHRLGTICLMDTSPRRVDAGMCRVLNNFGELAVRILERHLRLAERLAAVRQAVPTALQSLVDAAHSGTDIRQEASVGKAPVRGIEEGLWPIADGNEAGHAADDAADVPEPGSALYGKQSAGMSLPDPAAPSRLSLDSRKGSQSTSGVVSPADALLMSVFARQIRNLEAVQDACCLVVDTGAPGWPVLYADATLKLWAGFPRAQLLGRNLQGALLPAAAGVAPLNWAALQQQAEAGERFVVSGVVATAPGVPRNNMHSPTKTARSSLDKHTPSSASLGAQWPLAAAGAHVSADCSRDLSRSQTPPRASSRLNPQHSASERDTTPSVDAVASLSLPPPPAPTIHQQHAADVTETLLDAVVSHEAVNAPFPSAQVPAGAGEPWTERTFHGAQSPMLRAPGVHGSFLAIASAGIAGSQGTMSTGSPVAPSKTAFDLCFRPMALDVLDADALPLGIPSWVPLEACPTMMRLYAVRLHAATAAAAPHQPLAPSVKVSAGVSSALSALASHLFPGLSVGQVLGRGGYGTAYTATWHDVAVVVKTQDHHLEDEEALRTAQIEIALGQMLRHPHLVRTLAHGAAEVAPSPSSTTLAGGRSASNLPQAAPSRASFDTAKAGAAPPSPYKEPSSKPLAPIPVHSGFSPLSEWLLGAEQEWDGFGDSSWFSHCDKEYVQKRSLLRSMPTQQLADKLPPVSTFINAVAAAEDAPQASRAPSPALPGQQAAHGPADAVTETMQSADAAGVQLQGAPQDMATTSAVELAPPDRKASSIAGDSAAQGVVDDITYQRVQGAPFCWLKTKAMQSASKQTTASGVGPLLTSLLSKPGHLSTINSVESGALQAGEWEAMMGTQKTVHQGGGAQLLQFPMHLRTFAIIELCDGGTLTDAIDRGWLRKGSCHVDSPADLLKIVTLGSHIASAVAYLHEQGVVHADLSSANVLLCNDKTAGMGNGLAADRFTLVQDESQEASSGVNPLASLGDKAKVAGSEGSGPGLLGTEGAPSSTEEDQEVLSRLSQHSLPTRRYSLAPSKPRTADDLHFIAKVADFGKSCLLGPEGVMKAGGYATVTHMAPEVLLEHLLSTAADVYAVGVLLWQMFTGSRPWASLSHRQIIATVASGAAKLEWPAQLIAKLPKDQQPVAQRLASVAGACCAHASKDRPSMAQVHSELVAMQHQLSMGGSQ